LIDTVLMFFIAAAIIIIGFLANILFKRTGWPEILFLIFIGIILGSVLNLFSKNDIMPFLPLISTFTLLMVLLGGGLELNLSEISDGGFRSIFQTIAYFALGLIFVTLFHPFYLGVATDRRPFTWINDQHNRSSRHHTLGKENRNSKSISIGQKIFSGNGNYP
jgi:Kef-type K+ transport system membrane component KefB